MSSPVRAPRRRADVTAAHEAGPHGPKPAAVPMPRRRRNYADPSPKWHRAWTIDVSKRLATHDSGVAFDFRPGISGGESRPEVVDSPCLKWHGLLRDGTPGMRHAPGRLMRLCLEAAVLFGERAWDACQDCAQSTAEHDYYMVEDELWVHAHPARYGMLCLACLEYRIKRPLVAADFIDAPVNAWNAKVCAIRDGAGAVPTAERATLEAASL